jgi:hypothetical protein
MCSRKQAN